MSQRVSEVVKSALIRWARETAGFAADEAAKKIGVKPERLVGWEEGSLRPTVAQLRKAADVYKRPFAAFFLAEPPEEPVLLHDFRRLPTGTGPKLSPELVLEMRRARRRRAVAIELLEDLGRLVPEIGLQAELDDDPEDLASAARARLGVSLDDQTRWMGEYDPLNAWVTRLEDHRILIFQTGDVALGEMRGFSLAERRLPAIVLNAKDSPRGRVFTLMHEFTHLMLNQGGICDPLRIGRHVWTPDERIEIYCNRVAGAILVPRDALLGHRLVVPVRGPVEWTDEAIAQLAQHFAVSREVVLRRLLIVNRTTGEFDERKRGEYLAQYEARAQRQGDRQGFAPHFRVVVRDNGRPYTRLVLEALDRERITLADVSDYLDVRLKHLADIAGAVERVGAPG